MANPYDNNPFATDDTRDSRSEYVANQELQLATFTPLKPELPFDYRQIDYPANSNIDTRYQ